MNPRRFIIPAIALSFLGLPNPGISQQVKTQQPPAKPQQKAVRPAVYQPVMMPYNRALRPAGTMIRFGDPGLENHALDAVLLPGGRVLAVEDRYGLAFINTHQKKLVYRLSLRDNPQLRDGLGTYSGLKAARIKDSTFIFWSVATGNNKAAFVVQAYWDGQTARIIRTFSMAPSAASVSRAAIPNEVAVEREGEEEYLYTVLNGCNEIVKTRIADGKMIWTAPTGVAPFGLAISGKQIFVTNWGGKTPGDTTGKEVAGVPWGSAYIDPATGAINNGSVTVLDRYTGKWITEIPTGLHPNAIKLSPGGRWAFVACSNSDNVFIINTATGRATDSVPVGLSPVSDPFIGDSPDGLALSPDGKTLYVANGMDNAVAVVRLAYPVQSGEQKIRARLEGFIPTGAYPAGLQTDGRNLHVCNLEGEGSRVRTPRGFNSHHELATVSIIPLPSPAQLKADSRTVYRMNLINRAALALRPPRSGVAPAAVPERIGEPSLFRHVVYIIKENRTYDQVLGDMKEGNGDTSLCVFGEAVTPNQHQLARDFCLLDNYFASGKCSAEGHQWTDAAMVTDYVEKNVRAWFRSYPHVQNDALVYDKNGFIWNNALDHGKTVRIFGEAATPHFDESLSWKDIYSLYKEGKPFHFYNTSTISRVRPLLSNLYPGYDGHKINDQIRADAFIRELREADSLPGDQWPDLVILALPADHTSGLRPGFPAPASMVADNDLALGRIVEAITRSRFWDSTVVFVTEDDSQDGWDHVSAYRTTGFVVSPYSHLHQTVHNNYNQTSMVRTIEQILGIPPMNALDATATPMYDCFARQINTAGYQALPARTPLDNMNPPVQHLTGEARKMAILSSQHQFDHIDGGNDDLLNRILWFATMKNRAYPAEPGTSK